MKRKTFALLFALLLAALLPAASLAAQFTIGTNPERLEGAGTVTLNITMQNDGSASMENIIISGPGVNYAASGKVIQPGESMFFPLTGMAVSEDMLGQTLTYTVSWTENGEVKTKSLTTAIGYANELAFSAERTADKTKAVSGDTIVLTYTIKNTGTVDLRNVKITDKKLARSTPVATADIIKAGETATFTYSYKMKESTVVSKPVITYVTGTNNTERTYSGISELSLGLINSQLTIEVKQGTSGPEGTAFTLKLENNGNQTLKKLVVTDDLGNRLNESSFALAVGESRTFEYTAVTDSSREVRFTISGVDGAGLDYEESTGRYLIRAYIDPSLLSLSFRPSFVTALSGDGTATMRFEIINNGSVDMTDAVLSESELGVIKELGTISPGTDSFEAELDIGSPRELVFTLTAKDPVGGDRVSTAYITASYAAVSAAPAVTPAPSLIGDNGEDVVERNDSSAGTVTLGDSLLTISIVTAVLTAIAAILLAVASSKDKQRARQHSRAKAAAQARNRAVSAEPRRASAEPQKNGTRTAQRPASAPVRKKEAAEKPAAPRQRSSQHSSSRSAAKSPSIGGQTSQQAPRSSNTVGTQSRNASRSSGRTENAARRSGTYAPRPYNPGRSFTEESTTRAYPRPDSASHQASRTEVRRVRPRNEDDRES